MKFAETPTGSTWKSRTLHIKKSPHARHECLNGSFQSRSLSAYICSECPETALGSELLICAAGLTLEVSGAGTPLRRWVVQKGERKSPFWSGFTGAQNALVPMGAGRANSPASGKPAIRFMVEQGSMPRLAIGRMGCNGKRAAGFPCRSLACEAEKRMPL
jgi:hypothetical protein